MVMAFPDFTKRVKNLIRKHGNEVITDISYIKSTKNIILHLFRHAFFKKKYKQTKAFHIELKITTEKGTILFLEKTFTIRLNYKKNMKRVQEIPIPREYIHKGLTLCKLLENTKRELGADFSRYYATNNNCQQFVLAVMKSNEIIHTKEDIIQTLNDYMEECYLPIIKKIDSFIYFFTAWLVFYYFILYCIIPYLYNPFTIAQDLIAIFSLCHQMILCESL